MNRCFLTYIYVYIYIYNLGPDQVEDIKQHPFFAPIIWDDLLQKKADPPFKPTIVPDETFHFDSSFTSKTPKGKLHQDFDYPETLRTISSIKILVKILRIWS